MYRSKIDRGWGFVRGVQPMFRAEEPARIVDLPHDFQVEQETVPDAPGKAQNGYYGGSVGTYTKDLELGEELIGKRILLELDGVYMNSTVEINGNLAASHYYGYTPFRADLTPYVKFGKKNTVRVIADNTCQPNSRWYSGAGMYRGAVLLTAGKVHIAPDGIYVWTKHIIDGTAVVEAEVTLENHTDTAVSEWVDITIVSEAGGGTGTGRTKAYIPAGGTSVARVAIPVAEARLWSPEDPALYTVKAALTDGEGILDEAETGFGIRTITVDPVFGFRLNGRAMKLKGGCIHHDNGLLGSESYYDSEYRKLRIHKENGYNAVRTAHNPPSRVMLEAADRLGMMVLDEAFDCWRMGKNLNDYSRAFERDWQKDIAAYILRDRNHPCVIIWSTGNEIVERAGLAEGYLYAEKLASFMRSLDPTRPVLNALCGLWNGLSEEEMELVRKEAEQNKTNAVSGGSPITDRLWAKYTEAYAAPLDIVGYNYLDGRYAMDGEMFPNRVICGTESFPKMFDRVWRGVLDHPYVIGDFTWTSWDYIGEAGIGKSVFTDAEKDEGDAAPSHVSEFPWRLANDSDFDLLGFERPALAFRKIVWGSDMTYLAVRAPKYSGMTEHVSMWGFDDLHRSWTWPGFEGKGIRVNVMSRAEEVALILNGKEIARGKTGEANRFRADLDIIYEPGTLEAVSYTAGKEIGRDTLYTVGEPVKLVLLPERETVRADGYGLAYVTVELRDAKGDRVPCLEKALKAEVGGSAVLAAFGSAQPVTVDRYTAGACLSFDGRAQLILRSDGTKGDVLVRVEAEGMSAAEITLKAE